MRKLISTLMLLVLAVLLLPGAYAEGSYRIAGYDHEDTGHDWENSKFFERLETLTGVKVEAEQYLTQEAWDAAREEMFAEGGDMPDALFKANLTNQETQKLYEAGKIIDLTPYLAEYAPDLWALLEAHPDWMEAVTLPDGAIAALPAIDELQFNNAMWINQKWLDKLKLSAPTTAQELMDVLIAFRDHDMNGNGKKGDEIPLTFSSLWDLRFLAHAFGLNANDYYVAMDENGVVSQILTTEENRAFLTWLHEMYDAGLLDENGFTGLRDMSKNTGEDAEIVYGVLMSSTPAELVPVASITDYVLLEPLVYEGQQVYRDLTGDVVRGTFAITSACKDPAALVTWVNTFYTEEGFILSEAGIDGEEFSWNDDGTWMWESTSDQLTADLAESTLRAGVSMPGYASVSFQQALDDASTQHVVDALLRLKAIDTLPYPLVYLTEAQQSRVDELIFQIGRYAEYQMVWFVTGDTELNDETWNAFCEQVNSLCVEEMVAIFQTAADNQQ